MTALLNPTVRSVETMEPRYTHTAVYISETDTYEPDILFVSQLPLHHSARLQPKDGVAVAQRKRRTSQSN